LIDIRRWGPVRRRPIWRSASRWCPCCRRAGGLRGRLGFGCLRFPFARQEHRHAEHNRAKDASFHLPVPRSAPASQGLFPVLLRDVCYCYEGRAKIALVLQNLRI
jgi:hypothetical protein